MSTPPSTSGFEQDRLATVRGRIGITLGSSGLLYLTGGGAWANLSLAGYQPASPFASASQDLTKSGWTVGTGYEVKLTPAWSFKAEYLYVDLARRPSSVRVLPSLAAKCICDYASMSCAPA